MRENNLLSPHRVPKAPPAEHDGTIIMTEPNLMWPTDGARVFTLDDGWGWVFACVEHLKAECMGWHVCKKGNRFAALEPVSMALEREFGHAERGVARGISLRTDNGCIYTSGRFTTQVKALGLHSQLLLRLTAGGQRGRRAVLSHPQRADRLRVCLQEPCGSQGGRREVR